MAGREAFDAMVDEHGRTLPRTAYLLTGDAHLAHDLRQTALVETWGAGPASATRSRDRPTCAR